MIKRIFRILLGIALVIGLILPSLVQFNIVEAVSGWRTPTGYNDPSTKWSDEANAIDDQIGSAASSYGGFGYYLEVSHSSILCDKIRVYASHWVSPSYHNPDVAIDVYYSGGWHNIWDGIIASRTWVEKSIGSSEDVTKARMKFNDDGLGSTIGCGLYELHFWEIEVSIPTVTTQAASSIEETTATGNGNITDRGEEDADHRGIVYGTTTQGDPGDVIYSGTTYDSYVDESGSFGTGAFTRSLTSLTPGETYYARAYAHNSIGYSYGGEVNWVQKPNEPTLLADTGTSSSSISLSWTKGTGAEKTMIRYQTGSYPATVADGSQGYFDTSNTCTVSTLDPNTTYYFRAWSYTTNAPNSGYSDTYSEDTATTDTAVPTISTSAATLVEETTATLNGNITNIGGENCDQRGFDWGLTDAYGTSWTESASYGTGVFSHAITSLDYGTTYHFRAKAHNSAGWGYGSDTTLNTKPEVPTSLSASASASGTITLTWSKGIGATSTYIRGEAGSYPTDRADGYEVYNGSGVTEDDTGLTGGTTYYYRAWSESNSVYSDNYDQDFAAAIEAPSVTTNMATSVERTTATLNGEVTITGGQTVTERGYVWDTTTRGDPGNTAPGASDYSDEWTESGAYGVESFDHDLTSLAEGDTFYFRACAYNIMGGWTYGSELSFETLSVILLYKPNTIIDSTLESATADSGSTTTIIDTQLTQANDYWNLSRLIVVSTTDGLAPQSETSVISDFVASTDTLTFGALTAAMGVGDNYTLEFAILTDDAGSNDAVITWGYNSNISFGTEGVTTYESTVYSTTIGPADTLYSATQPDNWYGTADDITTMPLYESISELSGETGIEIQTYYVFAILGIAVAFGLGALLFTGSVVVAALAAGFVIAIGAQTTMLGWWMLFTFGMFAFGIIYLTRHA